MILIIALTVLVVVIPAIHVLNARYLQRIALFIGTAQLALLAFSGSLDNQLKEMLISGCNQATSYAYAVVIQKISYLLFTL
jgi:hypothetical protein